MLPSASSGLRCAVAQALLALFDEAHVEARRTARATQNFRRVRFTATLSSSRCTRRDMSASTR